MTGPRQRLWSPPAHWRLLAFCLLVLGVLIAFQGYATHTIGPSSETTRERASGLAVGRSLLVSQGGRLVSRQPAPGRRIALSFDDGPDPRWTPEILAILRREHVPATFFVVGSHAARHPDLLRRELSEGHEVGNHTFTHPPLASGASWRDRLQLELTQATITGATGHYARLLRPPYAAVRTRSRPSRSADSPS